jgi:hypothetical protein
MRGDDDVCSEGCFEAARVAIERIQREGIRRVVDSSGSTANQPESTAMLWA